MRIIIEGNRSEGKSTLAIAIEAFLRKHTNYSVVRVEEGALHHKVLDDLAEKASVSPKYFARGYMDEPRRVEIFVRNP